MTAMNTDRPRWARSIVTALLAAPLIGLAAGADKVEAKKADKPKDKPAAAARPEAKGKKEKEKEKPKPAPVPLPDRPKRTITAPSLDAAGLDALIEKALLASKTPVPPVTTDEEFVRRVYLDVTGKLPTIQEMRGFVHARDKAKRAKLIDALLQTPAFADNWARYWRDVIAYRAPNGNTNQTNFPAFEAWLASEFARDRPWDEIASAIITAEGANDANGATSFGLAESAQAVEMAGEVSRVFLGVQIQCAQCHDHPTDPWKRQQFHEFAAFFTGLRSRRTNKDDKKARPIFELTAVKGVPRYTMPDLKEPTKQIAVEPRFFLGDSAPSVAGLTAAQRRTLAASYVTGQDNPWFARAFVNRVWGVLMGEGFTNPVDDMGPTKEAHDPEVLDALASAWQKGGYDVRWLFRVVLNTRSYQRESRSTNSASGRTPFAANCPTRLRADQILDNLAQALNLSQDELNRARRNAKGPNANKPNPAMQAQREELAKRLADLPKPVQQALVAAIELRNSPRSRFNQTFGVDPSTPTDDVLGTIPQALFLMNSPLVNANIRASNDSMLGEMLRSTPDNRAVLEALYLRVLARRPNAKEVRTCGRYIEAVGNRAEGFEDILWGLLNTTEFISRR